MVGTFFAHIRRQWMGALALFLVLTGGTAWAVDEWTGANIVNESLTGADVRGKAGTSSTAAVNGSLTTHDISGQAANEANGTPFVDGTLTSNDIKNESMFGQDIVESSLGRVPSALSAADSDLLDGIDSTGFYAAGSKVSDADRLDGLGSTAFSRNRAYTLSRSTVGRAEEGGACQPDEPCLAIGNSCDIGDILTGGGFSNIDNGTRLVSSETFTLFTNNAWKVVFVNNSTADTIQVHTLCLDNGDAHT